MKSKWADQSMEPTSGFSVASIFQSEVQFGLALVADCQGWDWGRWWCVFSCGLLINAKLRYCDMNKNFQCLFLERKQNSNPPCWRWSVYSCSFVLSRILNCERCAQFCLSSPRWKCFEKNDMYGWVLSWCLWKMVILYLVKMKLIFLINFLRFFVSKFFRLDIVLLQAVFYAEI